MGFSALDSHRSPGYDTGITHCVEKIRAVAMQVRQITRSIQELLAQARNGVSDAATAAAVRRALAPYSWSAQRHGLLYFLNRAVAAPGNIFWDAHPRTLRVLQMHCAYALSLHTTATATAVENQFHEHSRWLATSGHPLAERLVDLAIDGCIDDFDENVANSAFFDFRYFEGREEETWLPFWGRTFLVGENDDLSAVLGSFLSVTFRDLWALWDSSHVPDNATCRLVFLQEMLNAWQTWGEYARYALAKQLNDRMGDHLRLAAYSLAPAEQVIWEKSRGRLWEAVKRQESIRVHLKSLEMWGRIRSRTG